MTIRPLLAVMPFVVLGWLITLTGVVVLTDRAPAYVVLFPGGEFVKALPEDVSIVAATPFSITLASERPTFARSLYRQGALIVLPAGLSGCLPLSKTPQKGRLSS